MSAGYTVALIADHQLFLDGLCAVLAGKQDLRVVACTAEGRSAPAVVLVARPDVVVLDLAVQGGSGISVARKLLRDDPDRRVLALGAMRERPNVAEVLEAGVCGYACKEQPAAEVVEAIREVARGRSYLAPQAADAAAPAKVALRRKRPLDRLTAREREIFDMTITGRSSRDIAGELTISPRTVETHRARILRKLEAHSTLDLVRLATTWGLLPGEKRN
jgi:DNA-binding NarL/FixJ family response regulator